MQDRPEVGEIVLVSVTVPLNPDAKATVIVDDPVEPAKVVTLVGLALTPKAVPTLYVTVVVRLSAPLVPDTVTVNVCEVTEGVQDSVAIPEDEVVVSVMLVGLIVHVRPVEGDGLAVRLIVPAKPLGLETVIVDDPGVPEKTRRPVGLALKVKSCTVYVTLAVWLREDPEPVTVTV